MRSFLDEIARIPSVEGGVVTDKEHYFKNFDLPFIERLYHQINPTIQACHFSIGIFQNRVDNFFKPLMKIGKPPGEEEL
jgi:hypothetical protein